MESIILETDVESVKVDFDKVSKNLQLRRVVFSTGSCSATTLAPATLLGAIGFNEQVTAAFDARAASAVW